MPIGIIINASAIFIGGILGTLLGHKLSDDLKNGLSMVFGLCSMGMGIASVVLMSNMPAVILSIILGTAFGITIKLGDAIRTGAALMQKPISAIFKNQSSDIPQSEFIPQLVTALVLFCASGTGIYGSITSGMTGDHSILIAKSMLDFFTAMIFACSLGYVVSVIALPQFIIFIILFFLAQFIFPLTTPEMINDFKACGGFLMIATGFRMINVKMFPVADMIPSMILVMPFSYMWVNYVMQFVS